MQEKKTMKPNIAGPGGTGNHSQEYADINASGGVKGWFQRLEEEVKHGLFNVMYILLKDSDISVTKLSILLFIEFLQMLQYAFSENFKSVWKSDSVLYYITTFLNFSHIEPWMSRVSLTAYIAIFYICVGIVAVTLAAFILVAYQAQNQRNSFALPQQILRQICIVTNTILFLPSLELFTSMIVCVESTRQGQDGNNVHYIYKEDFQCWTGLHIIHASIAIISSVCYIIISFVITLTFYKNLYSSTDAAAKTDSKADVQRLIQKVIVVYVLSFLNEERQQWFVIVLYFVLSALTFERYFYLRSYHNESVQLQHNVYRAVCLWSNVTILISKILQHTTYSGGLQLFLLGSPLVIALTIFNRDQRKDEMMYNITKFQRGDDIARQIKFFLQVVQKRESGDRNADILLNGFIYLHEDNCPNNSCQLKLYKKNLAFLWAQKGSKNKSISQSSMQKHFQMSQKLDNYQLLLQHAKNMFRAGIQKFPNSPALRISYSFFLIEKMNKKQEAIQELNNASLLHPTLDEEFIIFRHKRLSEEYFEEQNLTDGQQDKFGNNQAANNAVDLMTRFAFENTFRQLQTQIENCAHFHMEFWNQLKDDRPDLAKLGECGTRITTVIVLVDQLWNELMKLNSNAPKAMKLYGRYQIEILQDRETGQDFLQRAKEYASQKQNLLQGGLEGATDIHQISSDGTPCIFVSGEPDRLGNITQTNSGAVRVFGYQAFEMRNQKVEKLMPEMYSKNHQKILEEALAKGPENIPNKERLVFARHKSGYVFPVWLQLKLIQSIQTEIQFVALFKIDKRITNSNIGFVLINKDKKIQGISSSCMKMMSGLDLNMMRKIYAAGYDISKMAPDLEIRRDEIIASKNGVPIEWSIPFIQKRKIPKATEIIHKKTSIKQKQQEKRGTLVPNDAKKSNEAQSIQVVKKKFKFTSQIIPIVMGNFGEIGSYIRLDQYKGADQANSQNNYKQLYVQRKKDTIKQPLFQFNFDIYSGKFIRELRDPSKQQKTPYGKNPQYLEDELNKQSTHESSGRDIPPGKSGADPNLQTDQETTTTVGGDLQDAPTDTPGGGGADLASVQSALSAAHHLHHHHQEDLFYRKKKWGKDILIYALREGKVQLKDQIDEEKRMMELEELKRRKKEEEEKNLMELANFSNNIKSKQALKSALMDSAQSKAIRNLKYTMNIVILFLLALAISEFTVISGQFQEINENFGMIEKSYKRISEIQRISYDVRTLILINEGRLRNAQEYFSSKVMNINEFMKQDIDVALNSLYEIQDQISLSKLSLSEPHQRMIDMKLVPLYFLESRQTLKVINFTLTESVLQLSSAIFTVRHLSFDRFRETQEDIFFVLYNSFNDFLQSLENSSRYLEEELYTRSSEKNDLLLTLFIISLVIIVLSLPILFPAVNSVNKSKDRVLALFIEIPNNFITELGTRCESFLSSFYSEEQQEDEVKSEDLDSVKNGADKVDGSNSQVGMKRQIAKQPRNSSTTSKQFFIQFSIVVVLVIAYFTSTFVIAQNYLDSTVIVTKELSILASNEAHLQLIQNTQREMIYNKDKKIYSQNSFSVSREELRMVGIFIQEYLNLHQSNRNYHYEAYATLFDDLMNKDLCKHQSSGFQLDLIPSQCQSLFNTGTVHGLQTVMIMYLDLLRESLNQYQNATNIAMRNTNATIQQQVLRNASDQLLNSQTFRQLYWMHRGFLQKAFRKLISTLRETRQLGFESNINTKMALFIVFIIAFVLGYIIFWSPFVSRLSKDILRTKLMLTIIPIHIIMKIPKIQEYLNKQARDAGLTGKGSGGNIQQKGHSQGPGNNK